MEIVKVKFQNCANKDEFSGRYYSYFAYIPLSVGDIVKVPTATGHGIGKVVEVNVSPNNVGCPVDKLKTIRHLANTDEEKPQDPKQESDYAPGKGMRPLTIADTAGAVPAQA